MSSMTRVVVASGVGSMLEMYDFMIYILLSSVLVHVFFSSEDPFSALMLTFSLFAVGFLARPVGSALFGHFGDRLGRKRILLLTMFLMGIPSLLIALTPSYDAIGRWAPLCVLVWRLAQGIALGGEFSGALTFVVEHSPARHRARNTAWIFCFINLGIVLASVITVVCMHLFNPTLWAQWGWRLLFVLGAFLALLGLYFRNRVLETPLFLAEQREHHLSHRPIRDVLTQDWRALAQGLALAIAVALPVGMVLMYMPAYLTTTLQLPLNHALVINGSSLMILCLLLPLMGRISDWLPRRVMLNTALIGMLVLAYPLFHFLPLVNGTGKTVLLAVFNTFQALLLANFGAHLAELSPTRTRYTFVGIVYNIPFALFAGTVPMVALYLIHRWHTAAAPGWYLSAGILIGILGLNLIRITKTHEIR